MKRLTIGALLVLVPMAAVAVGLNVTRASGATVATAVLRSVDGARAGVVRLSIGRSNPVVTARVALPPTAAGFHGFHIHAVGTCDPASVDPATGQVVPFLSAGGHLGGGPGGHTHAGHDGDMPSLLVNEDGNATLQFQTDRVTLSQLFDADGSAVIVHAGPDNFANIPTRYSPSGPDATTLNTGDSGGRLLCGVLQ